MHLVDGHVDAQQRAFFTALAHGLVHMNLEDFLPLFNHPPPLLLCCGERVATVSDVRGEQPAAVQQALLRAEAAFPRKYTHFLGVVMMEPCGRDGDAVPASVWLSTDVDPDALRASPPPTQSEVSVAVDRKLVADSDKTDLVLLVGSTPGERLEAHARAGWVIHREMRASARERSPDVWPSVGQRVATGVPRPRAPGADGAPGDFDALCFDSRAHPMVRHALLGVRDVATAAEAEWCARVHRDARASLGAHVDANEGYAKKLRMMVDDMESDANDTDTEVPQEWLLATECYAGRLCDMAECWTNHVRVVVTAAGLAEMGAAAPAPATWYERTLLCATPQEQRQRVLSKLVMLYSLTGPAHLATHAEGTHATAEWPVFSPRDSEFLQFFRYFAKQNRIDVDALNAVYPSKEVVAPPHAATNGAAPDGGGHTPVGTPVVRPAAAPTRTHEKSTARTNDGVPEAAHSASACVRQLLTVFTDPAQRGASM